MQGIAFLMEEIGSFSSGISLADIAVSMKVASICILLLSVLLKLKTELKRSSDTNDTQPMQKSLTELLSL